ncbi:receptor-transporting protein 3-like [Takifugu rubripes]|uniref:receptor-transporting protein 3-like n=1 Tax=Takifugu rubripes TaxID=31033 RepID=UPI0011453F3A|nr:receptor-transporting protein 3-like [Takifugu rubripes]
MTGSSDWVPGLWLDIFNELLDQDDELDYGDQWRLNFNYTSLTDTLDSAERRRGWKIFCSRVYGNFECGSCRKTWPSARVTVLFHYRLRGERGIVIMRPLGQSCRRCQDTFELPGFSEDVVRGTLQRLFSKIRKNIYDEDDDDDDGGHSDNSGRGWSKPHESSLCEACKMGICSQNDECES